MTACLARLWVLLVLFCLSLLTGIASPLSAQAQELPESLLNNDPTSPLFALIVSGTTITVDSPADAMVTDNNCTLREAIIAANTDTTVDACPAGGVEDKIDLSGLVGVIPLTMPLPELSGKLTLFGPGGRDLTVQRAPNTSAFRIFRIAPTAVVTIDGLGISNGRETSGGGIFNDHGTLTIQSSARIFANEATSSGGGIFNDHGTLTIYMGSIISDNRAGSSGGGIYTQGGTVSLQSDAQLVNNAAGSAGGALFNELGTISISDTFIQGNRAASAGGGIFNSGNSAALSDNLTLTNVTLADNRAGVGGGLVNGQKATLTRTTFADNQAVVRGGAIHNTGQVILTRSTLSGNTAPLGSSLDNNALFTGQVTVRSSILAGTGLNCEGILLSQGFNLASDTSCGLSQTSDQAGINPMLAELTDNGGLTPTVALLSTSPALDKGDPTDCGANATLRDQRGVLRSAGGVCDVGAFERLPYATETVLAGTMLDAENAAVGLMTPLVGGTVRHLATGLSTRVNEDGIFYLPGIPSGEQQFEYDAATAYPYNRYGAYRAKLVLEDGTLQEIARPIYIMRINLDSAVRIEPNTPTSINTDFGVSVNIGANVIKNEDGTNFNRVLTISEVPPEFTPGTLPDNLDPGMVITVQPMGLTFSQPAAIRYPNYDELPPGTKVDLWSMDHASSRFFIAGEGTVSADGQWVNTTSGGIRESSWHFLMPPEIDLGDFGGGLFCPAAGAQQTNSFVNVQSGRLSTDITLPAYTSMGEARALQFVYSTDRANPEPIIPFNFTIPVRAALPNTVSVDVDVEGAIDPGEAFIRASNLNENGDETIRAAVTFDGSNLETGIHNARVDVTSNYLFTRITAWFRRQVASSQAFVGVPISDIRAENSLPVPIVNERNSPFGAGWGLAGLERIYIQEDGSLLLTEGSGSLVHYTNNTFNFDDFTDLSLISLNGTPSIVNIPPVTLNGRTVLRLTNNYWQAGSALLRNPLSLVINGRNVSFSSEFVFRITNSRGAGDADGAGADGFAFIIATNPQTYTAGGGIGYQGIANSVVVEFDTFYNGWDPGGNHVGININGSIVSTVAQQIPTRMNDGNEWFTWIDYDAQTMRLDVRVSPNASRPPSPLISHTIDIGAILGQPSAFVGFTSATGAGAEDNHILSWRFNAVTPGNAFFSPSGDSSRVTKNANNTFTRRFPDGSRHEFDGNGLQTAYIDRNGNTTQYSYDAAGRLSTLTDPMGAVTTFAYDAAGKLETVTDPANRVTTFTHDAAGDLIRVNFPDGTAQHFGYNAEHLMTTERDGRDNLASRQYDTRGRLVQVNLPDGGIHRTTNEESIGLTSGTSANPSPVVRPSDVFSTFTDAEGRTTRYEAGALGFPTEVTDPAGLVTRYERGADGRPTRLMLPSGAVYETAWDSRGNLTSYRDVTQNGTTQFTYEPNFNKIETIRDPFTRVTSFTYDALGNLTRITSPLNRQVNMGYNTRGLVETMTDPFGLQTRFNYDSVTGNMTHMIVRPNTPDARATAYTYTSEGYTDTITDPLRRVFDYDYDAFGRVTSELLPDSRTVAYGYDAEGNLTSLTPPGELPHQFTYNSMNQVASYNPPDVPGIATDTTTYEYNLAEQLRRVNQPGGRSIQYSYDTAGRLTLMKIGRGDLDMNYDTQGRISQFFAPGNVNLGYAYTNDRLNTVTWSGALAGSVGYGYDIGRRVTSILVNNANSITFRYDPDGAIDRAGALELDYVDANGLLEDTALVNVNDAYTYTPFGEVDVYTARYGANDVRYSANYDYDALGRITRLEETIRDTATTSNVVTTYEYRYDAAGRLDQVMRNGVVVESYTYDPNGNRLTSVVNGVSAAGSYDAQDRLTSYGNAAYTYTPNGELQTRTDGVGTTTYNYDELGNLLSVTLPDTTQITYLIDGQGRRVGRAKGADVRRWLWQDDLRIVAELNGSNQVVSRFVYATGVNVPAYMIQGGVTYRLITDHLGSVRLVINAATGVIAQRMDYDAWGNVTLDYVCPAATCPGYQRVPFGYAGGLYDPDTGLVRFGARDYDAQVGRWTVKDPIGFEGGDTNLYAYVGNMPTVQTDVTGLIQFDGRESFNPHERRRDALDRLGDPTCMANPACVSDALNDYNRAADDIQTVGELAEAGGIEILQPPPRSIPEGIAYIIDQLIKGCFGDNGS